MSYVFNLFHRNKFIVKQKVKQYIHEMYIFLWSIMLTSKISKKGQIVVPRQIREKLNIQPGEKLIFNQVGERVYIEKENTQTLPTMIDILKLGKPFSPQLIKKLRDEWD